jgi:hypothetical protein
MSFEPEKYYNDLPLLSPKAELETKAVLRKAIGANKALAELKGAGDLIPNQGVLSLLSRPNTYVCLTNMS